MLEPPQHQYTQKAPAPTRGHCRSPSHEIYAWKMHSQKACYCYAQDPLPRRTSPIHAPAQRRPAQHKLLRRGRSCSTALRRPVAARATAGATGVGAWLVPVHTCAFVRDRVCIAATVGGCVDKAHAGRVRGVQPRRREGRQREPLVCIVQRIAFLRGVAAVDAQTPLQRAKAPPRQPVPRRQVGVRAAKLNAADMRAGAGMPSILAAVRLARPAMCGWVAAAAMVRARGQVVLLPFRSVLSRVVTWLHGLRNMLQWLRQQDQKYPLTATPAG